MLMNPNWSESQESRIVLQESEECAKYFEDFVKYLYTGRLKLELINVMHILTLADKYNVKVKKTKLNTIWHLFGTRLH